MAEKTVDKKAGKKAVEAEAEETKVDKLAQLILDVEDLKKRVWALEPGH